MLIASVYATFREKIIMGDETTALQQVFLKRIAAIDINEFTDNGRDKRMRISPSAHCLYGDHPKIETGGKEYYVRGALQHRTCV